MGTTPAVGGRQDVCDVASDASSAEGWAAGYFHGQHRQDDCDAASDASSAEGWAASYFDEGGRQDDCDHQLRAGPRASFWKLTAAFLEAGLHSPSARRPPLGPFETAGLE